MLTDREKEILKLLMTHDLNPHKVAGILSVSEHTVKYHTRQARGKLNRMTTGGAILEALKKGLLSF